MYIYFEFNIIGYRYIMGFGGGLINHKLILDKD